jgi:hypothetical protein
MPERPFGLTIQKRSESEVVKACLDYLASCRFPAWRCNVLGLKTAEGHYIHPLPRGHADIQAILPGGRAAFIECKTWGGRVKPHQRAWQDRMRSAGCFTVTVYSFEDLRAALKSAGYPVP